MDTITTIGLDNEKASSWRVAVKVHSTVTPLCGVEASWAFAGMTERRRGQPCLAPLPKHPIENRVHMLDVVAQVKQALQFRVA